MDQAHKSLQKYGKKINSFVKKKMKKKPPNSLFGQAC